MRFSRAILNALLATSLAAGVAVAQDAPPPPDSQYPATNDVAQSAPQYERQSDPVYATPNSQTSEPVAQPNTDQGGYGQSSEPTAQSPEEGGYPQSASAPPAPSGEMGAMNGPQSDDDSQDPSSRVARMQFMDGQVSIQPGGVNDWVAGTLNRPMTTGDNVWTDKDSRSELNVGTGIFRMGAETSVTLANVADKTTQLQLHQGTLNLRVRHLYDGEVYEIDTPNAAFTVQKPGDYRFDVDPNADTTYITVWKGEGNATGDGPSVEVREHEKARFSNGTSMAYEINKAPGYDQFDEWAMGRDERFDHSKSAKYVSPDVIGSSDLDDYGTWKENSEYGNVWVPNDQGDDFQPYSNGNWIYQQPYGWTWVGYEPWGFAPYHYGRWVQGGWGWGWAPGPYAYWGSPYYAPAMVAWFGGPGFGIGWGGGFGFGFGGGWGWCALGWGEPFHPWYHGGRGYFNRVNIHNTRITNITNVTNNYYNNHGTINNHYANASRGLVATNGKTISNGMPVKNNRASLNNSQRAQMTQHPAATHELGNQLRPTAQGREGAQAASRHAAAPPSRATTRQTVSHLSPPARGAGFNNASARGNGGINTARPSAGINNGRNGGNVNNARSFNGANSGGSVPRPPSAGGQVNHNAPAGGNMQHGVAPTNRGTGNTAANGHYVPRPPSAGGTIGNHGSSNMPSAMARSNNNVARPGGSYSRPGQSYSAPRYSSPSSQPARGYSSPSPSRSYSSPSPSRNYSSPSPSRNYSSPSPSRSYSSPSYNARSYSSPSYGGGRGYSAPSYGGSRGYSAPSGGGHYSAPAYHGGGGGYSGGGHSSGGGGHASGGGGGHASSGGGHSGGGHH